MFMRLMRLCWWIGHSGVMAMIAAQLGLATIPLWLAIAPDGDGGVALRDGAAGREQGDVDSVEALLGQFLNHEGLAVERQLAACRAGGREKAQILHREAALGQAAQELDADGAGRADDCYCERS
jgi:hypothetical protein